MGMEKAMRERVEVGRVARREGEMDKDPLGDAVVVEGYFAAGADDEEEAFTGSLEGPPP